jgi:hypothetical protein
LKPSPLSAVAIPAGKVARGCVALAQGVGAKKR